MYEKYMETVLSISKEKDNKRIMNLNFEENVNYSDIGRLSDTTNSDAKDTIRMLYTAPCALFIGGKFRSPKRKLG